MLLFFVGLNVVLIVALLSRDHDISASQQTVVTAELDLGPAALERLPEHIHLSRLRSQDGVFLDRVRPAMSGLSCEGFVAAGSYSIDEIPGISVVFMTNSREFLTAAVHVHETCGVWVDVTTHYENGRRCIHSTLSGRGLDSRPTNVRIELPGVSLAELLSRARGDRPRHGIKPIDRPRVAAEYEQDYAEWIEWRKRGGVDQAGDEDGQRLAA